MKSFKDMLSSFQAASASAGSFVGIDIGSSAIKVVQLEEKKGVVTLVTYGELQLGPYEEKQLGESVTLTPKKEQEALVDVIRESAVTARKAVFAMPLASSFVTNATIEADPKADISALVRIEARKVIPASLSEVTLDWAEVEAIKGGQTNQRNVLIAAIQNVALERFKILMQFAGIQQPPTEIECFSSIRALHTGSDEDAVVIDIGATSTKLYISHKGLLMRMHRIRAGGAIATNRIASVLNISFEEAELKKQSITTQDPAYGEIKRAHDSSYERAFREFTQVLKEYEDKNGIALKSVYVSGGAALFPGMEGLIQQSLNRQVVLAHPFAKVAYPAFMQDTIKQIGPSFTVALGAALRSFE